MIIPDSAVSRPLDSSKCFTLHPWKTYSFRHQLGFSWKHSSQAVITAQRLNWSLTFPPLSMARYSFIQLTEQGALERTKMPKLRNGSKGYSNPGSIDCESGHSITELLRSTYIYIYIQGTVHVVISHFISVFQGVQWVLSWYKRHNWIIHASLSSWNVTASVHSALCKVAQIQFGKKKIYRWPFCGLKSTQEEMQH